MGGGALFLLSIGIDDSAAETGEIWWYFNTNGFCFLRSSTFLKRKYREIDLLAFFRLFHVLFRLMGRGYHIVCAYGPTT